MGKGIDEKNELYGTISDLPTVDIDAITKKLGANRVFFIARRPVPNSNQEVVYFSMKSLTNMDFLVELTFKPGVNACKVCLNSGNRKCIIFHRDHGSDCTCLMMAGSTVLN